jgi:hypothetical protein
MQKSMLDYHPSSVQPTNNTIDVLHSLYLATTLYINDYIAFNCLPKYILPMLQESVLLTIVEQNVNVHPKTTFAVVSNACRDSNCSCLCTSLVCNRQHHWQG